MSQLIGGHSDHLGFPISTKNINVIDTCNKEFLFHVKLFRQNPLSSCREEVENVSTNRMSGGHLCFPIGPKNTNLLKHFKFLLPIKFRAHRLENYFRFRGLQIMTVPLNSDWALVNRLTHTSWMVVVTTTYRPKSARNRCVIEVYCGVFVLSHCFFGFSVGVSYPEII